MESVEDVLFEFTADDVWEDFEFFVPVRSETRVRLDTVFVDNSQRTKLLVVAVLVAIKERCDEYNIIGTEEELT